MDKSNRLTKSSGLTIADVIKLSWRYYKSKDGDNKAKRSKIDIKSAKVVARKNYTYDPSEKKWIQTGRDIRIDFIVQSDPKSYKKTDNIKIHKYPCSILIHSIESGIYSTFKWRSSSLKKPIFNKPGSSSQKIAEQNIKNGIQLQFFYELEWVLKKYNLLYGRCWANFPPNKTNPKQYIFFDKHMWYIIKKFIIPLIGTNGGVILNKIIKNE